MYFKNIRIINKGPMNDVEYSFPFKDDLPIPVVLTGINGCGKTLVLANLLNAYINLKNNVFNDIPETDHLKYYKVQTTSYTNKLFTYFCAKFTDNNYYCDFSTIDPDAFKKSFTGNLDFIDVRRDIANNRYVHKNSDANEKDFNDVFLYFPVDRYYEPAWLNKTNSKLKLNVNKNNYTGVNYDNSIINNVLNEVEMWVLDLMLDSYIYELKTISNRTANQYFEKVIRDGNNTNILKSINELLTSIYKTKNSEVVSVRIGIGKKENRQINIILQYKDREETIADTFSHLSSGEIMVFCIFLNIIKNAKNFKSLNDVKGVVLIDEIDETLHIDFCKKVLPEMMSLFPKIQFIVTSHSPFFLLGMKDKFNNNFKLLSLPNMIENDIYDFEEIRKTYEVVNKDYSNILKQNNDLVKKILAYEKPIIITEGVTDVKHLKSSLISLQEEGKFSSIDVLFNDKISEGINVIENFALLLAKSNISNNKVIFIFDCDTKLKEIKLNAGEYKNLGNDVYAYFIPNPNNIEGGISIEQLYLDKDLMLEDESGRRIFFNKEFDEYCRLLTDKTTICRKRSSVDDFYKNNKIRIMDDDVIDANGNNIALSKSNFADYILNKTGNFKNVDFSNFEILWASLEKIMNE